MEYTWLVEKYLEGELSGEALRKFELEILTKSEVAEEVENVRAMNLFVKEQHQKMQNSSGLIEDFGDLENVINEEDIAAELEGLMIHKVSSVRKDVSEFQTKVTESHILDTLNKYRSNKILVRKASVWMATASFIVLIVVSSLLLIGNKTTDYAALYSQFYLHRYADVERAAGEITQDPLQVALRAYNSADYTRALQLMDNIPEEGVSNKYYLYKGLTAMELGKYPLAIELFHNLDKDVSLKHEGIWFQSLCYLGMENEQATRQALNEIIRTDGYYKNMASALLKKI